MLSDMVAQKLGKSFWDNDSGQGATANGTNGARPRDTKNVQGGLVRCGTMNSNQTRPHIAGGLHAGGGDCSGGYRSRVKVTRSLGRDFDPIIMIPDL